MSVPRLYLAPNKLRAGARTPIVLEPAQSHYLHTVLRKRVGACVRVFNAQAGEWAAELAPESTRRSARLRLGKQLRTPPPCHANQYSAILLPA